MMTSMVGRIRIYRAGTRDLFFAVGRFVLRRRFILGATTMNAVKQLRDTPDQSPSELKCS
jgi:hypothetical protein